MRGKRNAAKPEGAKRVLVAFSVKPETAAKIQALKAARNISAGKALDAICAEIKI